MPDDIAPELPENVTPDLDFPVVGIGASAGGLEAVTEMVRAIDELPGFAFVLIQHLDPTHESMMAELLSRKTKLTVRQVEDGEEVLPDHLYVIPPGHGLAIREGHFALVDFDEPRGLRRPIDTFFGSLARAQGPAAASVVLSGTGSDGSTGMRAIKDAGGVCVAQEPQEARYDGMPHAAISTGLVDYTLTAGDIVGRLESFFSRRLSAETLGEADEVAAVIDDFCSVLRDAVGHDFSGYKRSTIVRRIERRMQILEIGTARGYLAHLRGSGEECEALFTDLLINVTRFFRDRECFEALCEHVIEPLVRRAGPTGPLRVWVPGCSSGQEAYTIAMLFEEAATTLDRRPQVQIFATDIDSSMIAIAREGRYSTSALVDIPEAMREAYTIGLDGQFQVVPRIREMIRFSEHSLIKDPPFSKIDLISCRNLLIYLGDKVQSAVLPLMHFSLRDDGFLFLGNSEAITRRADLFDTVDGQARIFRRREAPSRYPLDLPGQTGARHPRVYGTMPREQDFPATPRQASGNAAIFEAYAPPFARIDEEGRMVDGSGDLSPFLRTSPTGEREIGQLAREGLREVLTPLLGEARSKGRRTALRGVTVVSPFGSQTADVVAHPLRDGTVALVFIVRERFAPELDEFAIDTEAADQRVFDLEEDLRATRFRLKTTVEEVETANEELKSSNEEMMSMNEELQSSNEELTTANEELKNKIDELAVANADLATFLQSTDLAIIILDRSGRVRHHTEAARAIFPLQDSDRGRPISEIANTLARDALPEPLDVLATGVVRSGEPYEKMVSTADGETTFILRILPYRSPDQQVDGTTLTFGNVTRINLLESRLRLATQRSAMALSAAAMGAFELDTETGEITVDDCVAFLFDLGEERAPTLERIMAAIHPGDRDRVEEAFGTAVAERRPYEAEFRIAASDGSERWVRGVGAPVDVPGQSQRFYGLNYDITAEQDARSHQDMLLQEMSHRVKNLFAVLLSMVNVSPKEGRSAEEFAAPLVARIESLGRAYEMTRADPDGLDSVPFGDLVEGVLGAHADLGRVELEGPETRIPVRQLTPFGLILHELATNAVKHGALGTAEGRVSVRWRVEEGVLALDWSETDRLAEPPEGDVEAGFGTRLLKSAARQLRAELDMRDGPDGRQVTLAAPIE